MLPYLKLATWQKVFACIKLVSGCLKSYKKFFFVHNIRMINLSLDELKLIAKSRHIKDYKSMSKERLLSALNESESVYKVKRILMMKE